jgi:hypothetical protein
MPVALSPRQGLPTGVAVIAGDIRRHPVSPSQPPDEFF